MAVSLERENSTMIRRETHSSRALVTTIVLLLLVAGLAYLAAEVIASLMGEKILYPATEMWRQAWTGDIPMQVLIGIGIGTLIFGLFLLWKALAPGRHSRHSVDDERSAIVVDDTVVAASTSRAVRERLHLEDNQVTTSVDPGSVQVMITPTSGEPLAQERVDGVVSDVVSKYRLGGRVKTRSHISDQGVVSS